MTSKILLISMLAMIVLAACAPTSKRPNHGGAPTAPAAPATSALPQWRQLAAPAQKQDRIWYGGGAQERSSKTWRPLIRPVRPRKL